MRALLVLLHRWFGLAAAVFLFIAGLTGAVIAFDHELDAALNPQFFEANTAGPARPALELADALEAADPRLRVRYLPLQAEAGHSLLAMVDPLDPEKPLGFNQLAVDPATGAVQARRQWGALSLSRENLLPFLYALHYSLHLPESGGIAWGIWLMGLIGLVWVLDCFVAIYLSFPSRRQWRKSFAFRWAKGGHALTFDLHRSGGVWLWLLVLVVALTSVAMNLRQQVVVPLVSAVSRITPSAFETRQPSAKPIAPTLTRAQALAAAQGQARERGLKAPAGGIFYAAEYGVYGVGFFQPGNDHGDGGLGNPWIYIDGRDASPAGALIPGEGTAGDLYLQAQFPIHSGRILGLPGRILVSALGLAIAVLSVTGVLIWLRKARARRHAPQAPSAPALRPSEA
ncbi:PepSY-associated TM helix domain-containing protein [Roseateles sp. P5_E4]